MTEPPLLSLRAWPDETPLPDNAFQVRYGRMEDQLVVMWPYRVAVMVGARSTNPRLLDEAKDELWLPLSVNAEGQEHGRMLAVSREMSMRAFLDLKGLRELQTASGWERHAATWPERLLRLNADEAAMRLADIVLEPRAAIERTQLAGMLSMVNGFEAITDVKWMEARRRRVADLMDVIAGSDLSLATVARSDQAALPPDPQRDSAETLSIVARIFPPTAEWSMRPSFTRAWLEVADASLAMTIKGLKNRRISIPQLKRMTSAVAWPTVDSIVARSESLVVRRGLGDGIPPPERQRSSLPKGAPDPGLHSPVFVMRGGIPTPAP